MKNCCYLVVSNDYLALPCGCFDTCEQVAYFLGCKRTYVHYLIRFGAVYRLRYRVEKIKV